MFAFPALLSSGSDPVAPGGLFCCVDNRDISQTELPSPGLKARLSQGDSMFLPKQLPTTTAAAPVTDITSLWPGNLRQGTKTFISKLNWQPHSCKNSRVIEICTLTVQY